MFRKYLIKNFIVSFLICVAFMFLWADKPLRGADSEKQPSVLELLRTYQTKQEKITKPIAKERVVHFPMDRSLGNLLIQDESVVRQFQSFFYWKEDGTQWKSFGPAKGDVNVPEGKQLTLVVGKDGLRDLSPLSNLHPDDLYKLTIYGLPPPAPKPGDKIMPHIAHLTGLKVLELEDTAISIKGFRLLYDLKALEHLSLSKQLTDEGLAEISQLKSLKGLCIRESHLTNAGLAHLASLTSLEELALGQGRMTNAGLSHLAKLPSLQCLMLAGKNFTDDGMVHLKDIPSLRILHLGFLSHLKDAALVHLSNIPNLESLELHWVEAITDDGVAHLTKLPSLKQLDIRHSKVTDKGVAQLSQIKSLEYLVLPDKGITDVGLAHVSRLEKLKYFWLTSARYAGPNTLNKDAITDKGVAEIAKCKLLKELTIGSIGITDAGLDDIARLSNLKVLSLLGCPNVTNKGLAKLTALKSLRNLSVNDADITIGGLSCLNQLPNLVTLRLDDVRQDDSGLDRSRLTKLEDLSLYTKTRRVDKHKQQIVREPLHDYDLACLAKLTQLTTLQVSHGGITDNGLKHLSGLTNLGRLWVGGEKITDKGLLHLTNMSKLSSLGLTGNFTDEALVYLERLPTLTTLDIMEGANFSPEAVERFRRNMPELMTFQPNVLSATQQQLGPTAPQRR
jgi:Leucine-rich repeat (LRR) protein